MKIRPVGAVLFHVAGQTEGHDEADGGFSEFCGRVSKLLFRRYLKGKTVKQSRYRFGQAQRFP